MLTKTVSYNGASITVSRETVRSRLFTDLIYTKLTGLKGGAVDWETESFYFLNTFARFLSQCEVEGELGFPLALPIDDAQTLERCYAAFMNAPGDLYNTIVPALNEVDSALNVEELLPDADQKKEASAPGKRKAAPVSRSA